MGRRVSNKDIGIARPPTSYSLFCSHVAAARAVTRKRIRKKTAVSIVVDRRPTLQQWQDMTDKEKEPFVKKAQSFAYLNAKARASAKTNRKAAAMKLEEPGVMLPMKWGLHSLTIKQCIGLGSYSKVYQATDQSTGTLFAVKLPNHDEVSTVMAAVGKELQILDQFVHPNIVSCWGLVGHTPSVWVGLLFELADGALSEWLRENHCRIDVSGRIGRWRFAAQLASALTFIHECKFIHCDLDCNNILVFYDRSTNQQNMMIKLADFGSCRNYPATCVASHICSNIMYRSAELICQGDQETNICTQPDIWALGCVMFDLFATGKGHLMEAAKHLDWTGEPIADTLDHMRKCAAERFTTHCKHDTNAATLGMQCLNEALFQPKASSFYATCSLSVEQLCVLAPRVADAAGRR